MKKALIIITALIVAFGIAACSQEKTTTKEITETTSVKESATSQVREALPAKDRAEEERTTEAAKAQKDKKKKTKTEETPEIIENGIVISNECLNAIKEKLDYEDSEYTEKNVLLIYFSEMPSLDNYNANEYIEYIGPGPGVAEYETNPLIKVGFVDGLTVEEQASIFALDPLVIRITSYNENIPVPL